ncbi:MAG: beta-lactamase family protein, partial [Rubrivivax sp.]|nr:beta-lactamase family protein [Rubrivivax sp.]
MSRILGVLVALLLGVAQAAPDEDLLSKASGYPFQRLGPDFSLLPDTYKVGNFTNMERIFWPREIAASAQPLALTRRSEPFDVTYPFNGRTYTIADILDRQRITGLLILKGDTIVYEAYQYDRKPDHKFASFSMAKTVTALLVGVALGEGRIASLDDPAEKYAPDLKDTAYGTVTIRNLLRMTSGAKWSDRVVPGQTSDIAQLTADTFYRRGRGGAASLQRVRESVAPQGTLFNYSSAETMALGLALKGAVGTDLATYASEKLWKPMGAETPASWLTDWSGMESAFCCINATLRDYGRLGLLLAADGEVNGKQVVPKEFMLDATDPARQPDFLKPRKASQFFGYGFQTWLYPYHTRTFQARGLFGQEIIVQPSSKVVVVILSALRSPETASEIFVERNWFVGQILQALGGRAVPRRFVWNATLTMATGSRARWVCGQVACRPVHM